MNNDSIKLTTAEEIKSWQILKEKTNNLGIKINEISADIDKLIIQTNEDNENK
jgi:hypothetical protein